MTQQTLPTAAVWPAPGDPARRPRILALDLSLQSTGIAWTGQGGQLGVTSVRPATKGHERLNQLLIEIRNVANRTRPQLAIIEQPIVGKGSVIDLAGLFALTTHTLWLRQIPYVTVHLTHVKMYATGDGSSTVPKRAVIVAMQRLYHEHGIYIRDEDQADAAALLALALDAYRAPLAEQPGTHRRAIKAVQWPALESPVPGSATRAPLPGAGNQWAVEHPGIGIIHYPTERAAREAAGTAGVVIRPRGEFIDE